MIEAVEADAEAFAAVGDTGAVVAVGGAEAAELAEKGLGLGLALVKL